MRIGRMARCAVPARVQRAERIPKDVRIMAQVAPLNAAPDGAAHHPHPGGGVKIRPPVGWSLNCHRRIWKTLLKSSVHKGTSRLLLSGVVAAEQIEGRLRTSPSRHKRTQVEE